MTFLSDTVWPDQKLTLAMGIGLAAVLNGRMQGLIDTGTIIVNLCGASSTGKTTAEELIISAFARPTPSNQSGLIRTFNSTANGLYSSLQRIHGLPIALDDITTNPYIDLAELIYNIASGQKKARCTSTGELSDAGDGWSGLVIISSETPIQGTQKQNQGLQTRVLQTQGITWTPSAEIAEAIKRTVESHYGHIGYDFAKYVARFTDNDLLEKYKEARKLVASLMTLRDSLSDRIEAKYAVIALTLEFMKEHFKLSFDTKELMKILIAPEQEDFFDRDISKKALIAVTNFIVENKAMHFNMLNHSTKDNALSSGAAKGIDYGTIVYLDDSWNVYIPTERVRSILNNAGINEVKTVEKRWRDAGLIRCDNNRLSIKMTVDQNSPYYNRRCLCFVFKGGIHTDLFKSDYPEKEHNPTVINSSAPETTYVYGDDDSAVDKIFSEDYNENKNK